MNEESKPSMTVDAALAIVAHDVDQAIGVLGEARERLSTSVFQGWVDDLELLDQHPASASTRQQTFHIAKALAMFSVVLMIDAVRQEAGNE